MNRNKFAMLVLTSVCLTSSIDYLKTRREEIKKREEIRAKLAKDLNAIRIGTLRVQQKIMNGEYVPTSLNELHETLEFEYIAVFNE